jgi:hypothetical protein
MAVKRPTDYETYLEIMGELLRPIEGHGLDLDILKRLYESKLVYLENLRVKCFCEINSAGQGHFTMDDYQLILQALRETQRHVKSLILAVISSRLQKKTGSTAG